jgi:hypothetical protein
LLLRVNAKQGKRGRRAQAAVKPSRLSPVLEAPHRKNEAIQGQALLPQVLELTQRQ